MKYLKNENVLSALFMILLGVLFVALKGQVLGIAMTVFGVALIVMGVLDIMASVTVLGSLKLIAGIAVIVLGWTLVEIVLYVAAALLIINGGVEIYRLYKNGFRLKKQNLSLFLAPAVQILIGALLFFNMGGAIDWVFIVDGIIMIADGVLLLVSANKVK